ncbi:hypothetical protein [Parendozoicomonas haliclonae]|uniref:Uncharacterized protein n=1 Tax=Parendozoicomonas haliclonae TaxID=1960125 RepID=A0A1X7AIP8_9GAMM|nr:hypothetical protein [Parendozoicomonas haliclonae]SMA45558.1 hypothetical protein EHSB41UT_01949 [Parendozoicomonas haliclonae]
MNKPMTKAAAARIQSAAAKQNGGQVEKGSFAARAMAAAAQNQTGNSNPNWPSKNPGKPSGGNRGNNPPRNTPSKPSK